MSYIVLWLTLSEKFLELKGIDWDTRREECFCDSWQKLDDELGAQIIKDLHRTGFSICSGPGGSINQGKLKKILMGFARWNPEVGYCQGFNMLGALILEVMEKEENDSMKVMLYLIEGVLPSGYFSGSLSGLQVDMAVFRELMVSTLPTLALHLQRLQGKEQERCCEPPLTNVFTMQWFLTMFCTCLPITSVLRIWDLVLIEGSDILLRTALVIWSLLEQTILLTNSADEFYCKMGFLSAEMLSGKIIDSNSLVEKICAMGELSHVNILRNKHMQTLFPWKHEKKSKFYYSDDESDQEIELTKSLLGTRFRRKGSKAILKTYNSHPENRDRIALDISLLKKQYDRFRDRQRQAQIVLTSAVSRQVHIPHMVCSETSLDEKHVEEHGKRNSLDKIKTSDPIPHSQNKISSSNTKTKSCIPNPILKTGKQGDYLYENSSTFKIKNQESPHKIRRQSESSSYSEEESDNSSSNTSLCDEEDSDCVEENFNSLDASPVFSQNKELGKTEFRGIKFNFSGDQCMSSQLQPVEQLQLENIGAESNFVLNNENKADTEYCTKTNELSAHESISEASNIKCIGISQTLALKDVNYRAKFSIRPCPSAEETTQVINGDNKNITAPYFVNEGGVTNTYFERINNVKRPSYLDLNKHDTFQYFTLKSLNGTKPDVKIINAELKCLNNNSTLRSMNQSGISGHEGDINVTIESENQKIDVPISEKTKNERSSVNTYIKTEIFQNKKDSCIEKKTDNCITTIPHTEIIPPILKSYGNSHSDLAIKIIEENSKILRNILNKTYDEGNFQNYKAQGMHTSFSNVNSTENEHCTEINYENQKLSSYGKEDIISDVGNKCANDWNFLDTIMHREEEHLAGFTNASAFATSAARFDPCSKYWGTKLSDEKSTKYYPEFSFESAIQSNSLYKHNNSNTDTSMYLDNIYPSTIKSLRQNYSSSQLSVRENLCRFHEQNSAQCNEKYFLKNTNLVANKKHYDALNSDSSIVSNFEFPIIDKTECKFCSSYFENLQIHEESCDMNYNLRTSKLIAKNFQDDVCLNVLDTQALADKLNNFDNEEFIKSVVYRTKHIMSPDVLDQEKSSSINKECDVIQMQLAHRSEDLSQLKDGTSIIIFDAFEKRNATTRIHTEDLTAFLNSNAFPSKYLNYSKENCYLFDGENKEPEKCKGVTFFDINYGRKFLTSSKENTMNYADFEIQPFPKNENNLTASNLVEEVDFNVCQSFVFDEGEQKKKFYKDTNVKKMMLKNDDEVLEQKQKCHFEFLEKNDAGCECESVGKTTIDSKALETFKENNIKLKLNQKSNYELSKIKDDSISNRLASIKDIIKSIEILCEDKITQNRTSPLFIPIINVDAKETVISKLDINNINCKKATNNRVGDKIEVQKDDMTMDEKHTDTSQHYSFVDIFIKKTKDTSANKMLQNMPTSSAKKNEIIELKFPKSADNSPIKTLLPIKTFAVFKTNSCDDILMLRNIS